MQLKKYCKSMKSDHFSFIVLSSIGVIIFSIFLHPAYESKIYFWSLFGLIFIGSVALRVVFLRKREDILFFTAIFMTWLNFSQPYLQQEKVYHLYRVIPDQYLEAMSFSASLSIITLYLGFYFSFKKKKINPFYKTDIKFSSKRLGHIMLSVMLLFIVYKTLNNIFPELIKPIIGILSILDYTPSLISAGLTLILLRKRGNPFIIIILSVFLLIQFLIAVAQTLFIYVVLIVIVPFLIYYFETNKIPIISFLLVAVLITPIYILRHYFRRDTIEWWYKNKEVSSVFLINKGLSNMEETYSREDIFDASDKIKNADDSEKERFESVSYLGQCVFQHEIKNRPFLLGETFWWLPLVPVPRIILPFKPENKMSTDMAEDYGLRGHTTGSMNWPMLAEYYVNFSFIGMIILSFFQGLAYRFIYRKVAFGKGDLNLIILFSILLPVVRIEGNITLIFGQIIQFLLIWYILSITVLKNFRYKRKFDN